MHLALPSHQRSKILEKNQNSSESKLNLTLVQGIAKGEKMDFLIQKAFGTD
jgi:16S rRNA (uracil1498-N3)-methyltransferase